MRVSCYKLNISLGRVGNTKVYVLDLGREVAYSHGKDKGMDLVRVKTCCAAVPNMVKSQ